MVCCYGYSHYNQWIVLELVSKEIHTPPSTPSTNLGIKKGLQIHCLPLVSQTKGGNVIFKILTYKM